MAYNRKIPNSLFYRHRIALLSVFLVFFFFFFSSAIVVPFQSSSIQSLRHLPNANRIRFVPEVAVSLNLRYDANLYLSNGMLVRAAPVTL